ncbi:MAG TPA: hypothetical protein VFE33_12935 [Thermoanaerobaculia bacterium]|nr:hypothetical protein [Thermoanaerobaculia bacterium]
MASEKHEEQMRFEEIVPREWFRGDQPPRLRIRCYQMARATLQAFHSRPLCIATDRAVISLFYGQMPYFANPDVNVSVGMDFQLEVDAANLRRDLPEGAYTVLMVPQLETEYSSRLALEFTAGLVSSILGRNAAYRLIFDNTLDIVGDSTTINNGDVIRVPLADDPPDLSRSRVGMIPTATSNFSALPEAERNRVELALHWHAEAISSPAVDQFLKQWIALEALGMSDRENIRPLNVSLGEAYGCSTEEAQQRFGVGRIFGFRSKILHRGQRLPIFGILEHYVEALFRDVLFHKLGLPPVGHAAQVVASPGFDLRYLLHET